LKIFSVKMGENASCDANYSRWWWLVGCAIARIDKGIDDCSVRAWGVHVWVVTV
jgi:hypothetical protein